jgi:hypothetical protein
MDLRDPDKAVDFIIQNSSAYAKAKGERVYIETFLRSKKSLLMNKSDAKTVADREAYAYAHEEYIQLTEGLRVAVEVEEDLKWKLIAAQLRTDIWRSKEASNRNQDRATR